MIRASVARFLALRRSVRSLVYFNWIYSFAGSMVGIFTQIFLYQQFTSIALNVQAQLVFFTGILFGLCLPGYLAARYRLNVKHGFAVSLFVTSASTAYMVFVHTILGAYCAMFFFGIGVGFYCLVANTLELAETKDEERDAYASMLSAGNKILSPAAPAIGTLLIWISGSVLHLGTYTLLFLAAPVVYALGFLCLGGIRDYRPQPIVWADVRHFIFDRSNQAGQVYVIGCSISGCVSVALPLTILFILGTPLFVGVYSAVFAFFSAACVLVVARYRTTSNRLLIFTITSVGLALAMAWLGYAMTFKALVVFTILEGILGSVLGVTTYVISMKAMETSRSGSDFFATMILRDFLLWVGRCVGGLVYLLCIGHLATEQAVLSLGLLMWAGAMMLTLLGAWLFTKSLAGETKQTASL